MRDFTLEIYKELLVKLLAGSYNFLPFSIFLTNYKISHPAVYEELSEQGFEMTYHRLPTTHKPQSTYPICILRHDVDRLPKNALATAKIEYELGIKGTYYFRVVPKSFDKSVIKQIAALGHEIGYHYEEVDIASRQSAVGSRQEIDLNPLIAKAMELFKINLAKMSEVADIKTICMHGSPLSRYDNKLLWTKYDYRNLGIIGEPYLDIDWKEFGYLTDTGRRWDGVAIRDKVKSNSRSIESPSSPASSLPPNRDGIKLQDSQLNNKFRSTFDILNRIHELPDRLMITIHPERWTDNWFVWSKQLIWQNVKNEVKKVIIGIK